LVHFQTIQLWLEKRIAGEFLIWRFSFLVSRFTQMLKLQYPATI